MDGKQFDELIRRFAGARVTRLDALRGLAATAAGLAATNVVPEAEAKKGGKKRKDKKNKKKGKDKKDKGKKGGSNQGGSFAVCHCQGQGQSINCKTLYVGSQKAVDAHLRNHEADHEGECEGTTTTVPPTSTTTTTTTTTTPPPECQVAGDCCKPGTTSCNCTCDPNNECVVACGTETCDPATHKCCTTGTSKTCIPYSRCCTSTTTVSGIDICLPRTNDANRTDGLPHVNQLASPSATEVRLEFVNPDTADPSLVFFEYRINGVQLLCGAPHPILLGDVIYPGVCLDTRTAASCPAGPEVRTFDVGPGGYVEVRLALGGEEDWRFESTVGDGWLRFDPN